MMNHIVTILITTIAVFFLAALVTFSFIVLGYWTLLLLAILVSVWVVFSSLNIVDPYEVALRSYFGRLQTNDPLNSTNGLFNTGWHFMPWLPGCKLIWFPKKMFELGYQKKPGERGDKMSGNMLGVRSHDGQKLFVEMTVFMRLPYKRADWLSRVWESGVPLLQEELLQWIERAVAPDVLKAFGEKEYKEVMGGVSNEELDRRVNELLRTPNSLVRSCGLFGEDPNVAEPGEGEFFLRIENVHLQSKLTENLELVAVAKLQSEAAGNVAEKEAEETHGRVIKMVAKACGISVDDLKQKLANQPDLIGKPAGEGGFREAYKEAYDLVKRDRTGDKGELSDIRVGNPDGTPFADAGFGSFLAATAAFFRRQRR